jgi:hypothetical protein
MDMADPDASGLNYSSSQRAQSEHDVDKNYSESMGYDRGLYLELHQQTPQYSPGHSHSSLQYGYSVEHGHASPSASHIGSESSIILPRAHALSNIPQFSVSAATSTNDDYGSYAFIPGRPPGYTPSSISEPSPTHLPYGNVYLRTQDDWANVADSVQRETTNLEFKELGSNFDFSTQTDALAGPTPEELIMASSSSNSMTETGQLDYVNEGQSSRLHATGNFNSSLSQHGM